VNLNIPPADRYLLREILTLGIIPGPKTPKYIDSFLKPMVDEFKLLQTGIANVWNAYTKETFTLKAHICIVGLDMPAREKIMNITGM
jgi:hypothetical protein